MEQCTVCGKEYGVTHDCSGVKPAQTTGSGGNSKERRGFLASLRLAFGIVAGSFRLLWLHPILVVPLLPVFLMVIALEIGLLFLLASEGSLYWAYALIFAVAYCLMFSFAITSSMLQQIHEGRKPSLVSAISASSNPRMITSVFSLTAIWYALVFVLVIIETVVKTLVSRLSENLVEYVEVFFDTFAAALRMMGFMLIPIMVFEGVGLHDAYQRMKTTLRNSPISALSGLALTKMASALIFLIIMGFFTVVESLDEATSAALLLLGFPLLGIGWMLAMYLEQLFATALYLYATLPESPVVMILLKKHIGRELPTVPVPELIGQPTT